MSTSTELRRALEKVARRFRRLRLWGGLAICWLAWAACGAVLSAFGVRPAGGSLSIWFAGLAAASGLACALLALGSVRDRRWVARRIEAKHPDLRTGLLAAVEEDAGSPWGRLGFLQTAVIRQALEHRARHDWDETVPTRTLRGAQVAHALALAACLVVFAGLVARERSGAGGPGASATPIDLSEVQVDPGDASIERGSTLLVVARFNGSVPADAHLVVEGADQPSGRRGMSRSLEDPTFAGRVESVASDLSYRVEFEGRSTRSYRVRVFEYPELQRADARLVFPRYTSLEPKTVEDVRHVTAVEGTELTLLCRLNKDVPVARLVDEAGEAVTLTPQDGVDHGYKATLKLTDTRRYKVQLLDREGRPNKLPADLVVNVTRNRPAVVTLSQPSRDVRVSPVEELKLKAEVSDDYGVVKHGLSYSVTGREPRDVVLGGVGPAAKRLKAEHLIDFEALKAVPDQLVTYFFWAEDVGPDEQPRRTSGDMFFAEVRHFEEIFRQGEQPPGGSAESEGQQGGNAREADKLAELQKQIINGTWKLVRRETGAKPSDKFAADANVLRESQQAAIDQAGQLAEKLNDEVSKASLDMATFFMKDALKQLAGAADSSSVKALGPALAAEQSAYQALLKLRAREFEVIRNNRRQRQGGGGGGGSPSQQQLDQLELTDDENRYEEQRTARDRQQRLSQREQEQGELRQVLSRLRELAQRQNDLNERLKELRSALEAAKDPKAREEIERQLKRLRDQQQQILRDTDELRERMEREENRDRMADARQQVEQGREHVRQASEALEQGRLSQALTEGSRAGRQLNDLREELRKGTSDRFAEAMTDMREQARKLDEDQGRLTERLEARDRQAQPSLRDSGEREQVKQGLEQQRKRLDDLLERMRTTVQDAEETEPLLAKELFDGVRKATEQKLPDALKVTEQLADAGIPEEAAKLSRRAGQGLQQLREGVEKAARSVLGDETAALKRAQGELDDLADQVNREIAQATGQQPDPTRPGRDGQNRPDRPAAKGQGRQPGDRQQGDQDQEGQDAAAQDQPGDQPGRQGQPSGQQQGRQGQQGRQRQPQPGGQRDQQGQQGEQGQQGQQGQQDGQGQQGQQGQGSLRGGNNPRGGRDQQGPRQAGSPNAGGGNPSGLDRVIEGLANGPAAPGGNPITGEGFRQWTDRMRDVEELLNNPDLRAEAARIRDRVRGAREEFKRHAKEPDWTQLKQLVADPIRELRDRVAEEVRRRESPGSLVPIDRDPVPPQFAEGVRRYYERLGSGR
jgi:hypothetical protein